MTLIHHIKKLAHIKRFTHNIMTLVHHLKKLVHHIISNKHTNMKIGTAYGRALLHTHVIFIWTLIGIFVFVVKNEFVSKFWQVSVFFFFFFFQLMVKGRKLNYVRIPCFVARNDSEFIYTLWQFSCSINLII